MCLVCGKRWLQGWRSEPVWKLHTLRHMQRHREESVSESDIEEIKPIIEAVLALPRPKRLDALAVALSVLLRTGLLDDRGPRDAAAARAVEETGRT